QRTKVLVISRDDDWVRFAARSAHLVAAKNLQAALDLFNGEARAAALDVVETLRGRAVGPLYGAVAQALELYLEEFEADASSYYYFEIENGPAVVTDWYVKEEPEIKVLASSDESLTIALAI